MSISSKNIIVKLKGLSEKKSTSDKKIEIVKNTLLENLIISFGPNYYSTNKAKYYVNYFYLKLMILNNSITLFK